MIVSSCGQYTGGRYQIVEDMSQIVTMYVHNKFLNSDTYLKHLIAISYIVLGNANKVIERLQQLVSSLIWQLILPYLPDS